MRGVNGDRERRALRAFAEHLARNPSIDGGAIDELCRANSDLEPELRRLAQERAEVRHPPPHVELGSIAGYFERFQAERGAEGQPANGPRYVLLSEVAQGGMGVILHVWDCLLERPLAMKQLEITAPHDSPEVQEASRRFLVEAQVAAQLEHPGVVPIYDVGADTNGRLYFTMPLIDGRNLNEVFDMVRTRSGGWSLTRALLVLAKLCEVVAYSHSRGVIHRDLKPANVMVGAFGEIHVVDWGLAKFVDRPERTPAADQESAVANDARADETLDGTVAGTPPYMAPEQAQGRVAEISTRTDIYALGAILYRLLAGRGPYASREGQDDPATTVEWIRRGPPTPLRRVAPTAPPELVAICEKAMAWRPEDRYASVEDELVRDLYAFIEARVASAHSKGFWAGARRKLFGRDRSRRAAAMVRARLARGFGPLGREPERGR